MEMAEGYVTEIGLDGNNEIIGYKFVRLGVMMDSISKGMDPASALTKATGTTRSILAGRVSCWHLLAAVGSWSFCES